ncbi:MAG: hypothetical protein H7338_07530 [Candidatus Sericytochromatia bacterium]|nr:hypothetical protein [Candidatus Sericytochromatia bacterium]
MTESTWNVFDPATPDEILATVAFQSGKKGSIGSVEIETEDPEMMDFLAEYLEDPHDHHPAMVEGEGLKSGPHTQDVDQFDWAMAALGHFYPAFATEPVWAPDEATG